MQRAREPIPKPQQAQQQPASARPVRYFIIRSNCVENIEISVRESAWSTTYYNESRLNDAFSSGEVRLLFAVNGSGAFQGYAVMRGRVGQLGRQVLWDGGRQFGSPFAVEWRCLFMLPASELGGMRNPLNDNMPILKAKDGQEVPPALGNQIVSIMEQQAKAAGAQPPKQQVRAKGLQGGQGAAGGPMRAGPQGHQAQAGADPQFSGRGDMAAGGGAAGQYQGRHARGRGPGPRGGRGMEQDGYMGNGGGGGGGMIGGMMRPGMMGMMGGKLPVERWLADCLCAGRRAPTWPAMF